jgi:uncharacterized protein (TIGR03437 family)
MDTLIPVRRLFISVTLTALAVSFAFAATIGSGSPSAAIQQSFLNAYNRGQFPLLVNPVPPADVRALGTPGLVQEFSSRTGGTAKFALVKPDPNAPVAQLDTLQVLSDLYAYYTTLGVTAAGYPVNDTQTCPTNSVGNCNYQIFSKNYALFVFSTPSVNLAVRDPFYTAWNNNGGIGGVPGVVISAEGPVTSVSKILATQQLFDGATIFSYPVSSATPMVRSVVGAFNTAYLNAGGYTSLGLPTSDVLTQTGSGLVRQTFEFGRIELIPGGMPAVLFALSNLDITYATLGLSLNPGATAAISATTLDLHGFSVTDRTLTWTSTNGAVAKVTGNGYTAVVEGVSGGSAQIYVTAEGKTSAPLAVRVGSVCCLIGEGAPTPAQTQAFQNAVTRNNLSVATPVATPVTRQGAGYNQTLAAADGSAAYLVTLADSAGTAYVLTGPVYSAYLANGGFTGPVGYPASDLLPGGVQRFTSGAALAGSPVRLVPANIASKWFQLGGMAGQAGAPVADAVAFTSSTGMSGIAQSFAGGAFFGLSSGSAAGQAYFSYGAILARYLALSGTAGALGVPTGDIVGTTVLTQNFEGGYIDQQPGAAVAVEHFNPRHPAISATPAIVVPGGRVRISATGFTPASTLSFTITGQPAFSVVSPAGAYTWVVVIPAGAKSATVTIQATAKPGADAASTSYTVTSVPALLPRFRILSGDQQTGAPGAALPTPITAILTDSDGAPIAGVPVGWTTSPGATLQSSFVTDATGRVSAIFRLPSTAGVAVGSLSAGGKAVEFSALASSRSIQAYPAFAQADPQGALVATLASLLRFQQNGGALPLANGASSPAALATWLSGNTGYSAADSGAQIANPWVAAQFAKAGLFLEPTALPGVLDLVSAGTPVGLLLSLTSDGVAIGDTAVSAVGTNADGSIAISDPNPAFARTSLADYLNGFVAQGKVVKGMLSAALRIAPANAVAGTAPFIVAAPLSARASASSPLGACGALSVSDSASSGVTYLYCEGSQTAYELDLAVSKVATVVDLTGAAPVTLPANGTLAWQLGRTVGAIRSAVQTLSISAVTDSASFRTGLSPGALFTIFGAGFTADSTVTLAGRPVQMVATFPFQINALIPVGTPTGKATLQVTGVLGTASTGVTIAAISPGIFLLGSNVQGAIVNLPDITINSPEFPAQRGQFISIYSAGLGATVLRTDGLQATAATVSVVINTVIIPSSFAGLTPGFVGLYQVNVQLPANMPPTLNGTLLLQQGGQTSNTVALAVQ